jgi:hypothetical protein
LAAARVEGWKRVILPRDTEGGTSHTKSSGERQKRQGMTIQTVSLVFRIPGIRSGGSLYLRAAWVTGWRLLWVVYSIGVIEFWYSMTIPGSLGVCLCNIIGITCLVHTYIYCLGMYVSLFHCSTMSFSMLERLPSIHGPRTPECAFES